jgi:hypothetical protein
LFDETLIRALIYKNWRSKIMPNELIDPAEVRKEMDVMIEMITHPAFVDAMKNMKATPVSKRRELGKKTLDRRRAAEKGRQDT